jgi:hypothetical protein
LLCARELAAIRNNVARIALRKRKRFMACSFCERLSSVPAWRVVFVYVFELSAGTKNAESVKKL